jgi:hypothetical protein
VDGMSRLMHWTGAVGNTCVAGETRSPGSLTATTPSTFQPKTELGGHANLNKGIIYPSEAPVNLTDSGQQALRRRTIVGQSPGPAGRRNQPTARRTATVR